jgi:uncharacterized membrane protein
MEKSMDPEVDDSPAGSQATIAPEVDGYAYPGTEAALDPEIAAGKIVVVGGRLTSVDALRGLIMVLMALDHTRDFLTDLKVDPTNPATTTVPLFLTRWVTHFCAPNFVFLAGCSAYLMRALGKRRTAGELGGFLASRGLFLMVLEITLVRLGIFFNWGLDGMFLQVIWAIGLSMIVLAGLVACQVSSRWIGVLGALIVLSHNVLDLTGGLPGPDRPLLQGLVTLLLRPGGLALAPGITWFEAYPLLPWFGVMALGYAFGEILIKPRWPRVRACAAMGLLICLAFLGLRIWGVYGDPIPFKAHDTMTKTVMALLNCQKYPPSLLYVLMTIGPGLLLLAILDATEGEIALHRGRAGVVRRILVTLGRVPLFYYLLQWPSIHIMAILVGEVSGHRIPWFIPPFNFTTSLGYDLPFVYLMWALVVTILYFPCRWYADLRQRRRDLVWLSYL